MTIIVQRMTRKATKRGLRGRRDIDLITGQPLPAFQRPINSFTYPPGDYPAEIAKEW
jgi:hypothetical protein